MRSALLLLALCLFSCAPDDCGCDADALVRSVAAPDAFDCGRARTADQREVVTTCIEAAISRGEPFAGGWSRIGRDSEVRTYVVQDAEGTVWIFGFDGGVSSACPSLRGSRCTSPLERRPSTVDGVALGCDTAASDLALCDR